MQYPTTTYKRIARAGDINIAVDAEAISRLREVFLIAMISASLLNFVSLFGCNVAIHHGYAYALWLYFGAMRYVAALGFTYIGIMLYAHWNRPDQSLAVFYLKLIGAVLVFLSISCLYAESGQGGLLGAALLGWLIGWGNPVVWILSISVLLSGVSLMTRISWYQIGIFIYQLVKAFFYFQQVKILRRRNRIIDVEAQPVETRREWLPTPEQNHSYIQRASVLEDPRAHQLQNALRHFGIEATVFSKETGPVFTRYEVDLVPGVKSSAICGLRKDIARNMLVDDVKIIEVIPGKSCIGIEVPNENREICRFEDIQYRLGDCEGLSIPLLLGKTGANEIKATVDASYFA